MQPDLQKPVQIACHAVRLSLPNDSYIDKLIIHSSIIDESAKFTTFKV